MSNKGGRPIIHDHARWRELYDLGWGDARIARDADAHHTTVIHWRKKHGLPPNNPRGGFAAGGGRPRGPQFTKVQQKVEAAKILRAAGMSKWAIARAMQTDERTIKRALST